MLSKLQGYKTYIMCAIGVLGGVVLILEGETQEGIAAIWAALTAAAVRAGVEKNGTGN